MKNLKLGQTVVAPGGAVGEVTKIDAVEVTIEDNKYCYYREELSEFIESKYKIGQKLVYHSGENSYLLVEYMGTIGCYNKVRHHGNKLIGDDFTDYSCFDCHLFEKLTLGV